MQLVHLDLFELCYTDFKTVCLSGETKQNSMNSSVCQLSAGAAMLQFLSNK